MSLDADRLKRVSALFDELHELASDLRSERLAELRIQEPEVATILAHWLQKDAQSHGALDALSARFEVRSQAPSATPSDRSGQRIGAYELTRRVGRGGMGEVYEAKRPSADFTQKVAIKLLRRGLDSEDIVRRFLRERRILAQLEHPGIARLIDGGVSEDGLPYLVMEFVEGRALIEAANAKLLDLNARLNLFLQICDAVAYAHRRLIVHRDLKPSNVLLSDEEQPKLLDFGIAKLLDEVDDEHLTGTGMRVLTPGYAAPEQILGQPISTATDVYALGVILYELLTGQAPHQRRGKDIDRVTRDLDQENPPPPSAAVLKADAYGSVTHTRVQRLARTRAPLSRRRRTRRRYTPPSQWSSGTGRNRHPDLPHAQVHPTPSRRCDCGNAGDPRHSGRLGRCDLAGRSGAGQCGACPGAGAPRAGHQKLFRLDV
jgi:eukaryotic-like serine/threonine-protein kinase